VRMLVVVMVIGVLFLLPSFGISPVKAGTACEMAKMAHWYHPGLNMLCFVELLTEIFDSQWPERVRR